MRRYVVRRIRTVTESVSVAATSSEDALRRAHEGPVTTLPTFYGPSEWRIQEAEADGPQG